VNPRAWPTIGRIVFAVGLAGLGCLMLIAGDFLPGLQPVPGSMPGRALLADTTGLIFLAAAACLVAGGRAARFAARSLALWLALFLAVVYLPLVVIHPRSGNAWTSTFEVLAIAGAATAIALPSRALARTCIALSLLIFGALHAVFRDYVASVIPAWIPGHMFWALATGAAHIAAGAALLVDVRARLAAILAGAMFGSWVILLHIPRVAARPNYPETTSLFVAVAMCGACWLLVDDRA
jgi:hypothetical protein